MEFTPVSRKLIVGRYVSSGVPAAIVLALCVVGAVAWTGWLWIGVACGVVVVVWLAWLIPYQVAATGWREDPKELVITKGRMWHKLVVVPYSRIQYIDVSRGPLARKLGYAEVQVHTAAVLDSSIPGVPLEQAEALRQKFSTTADAEELL